MGKDLAPDYAERIENFKLKYEILMEYAREVYPDISFNCTWKVHALVVHLPQFLQRYKFGMSVFAEQCLESVHHDYKKTEKRFLVHDDHCDHVKRQKRSLVEYDSRRLKFENICISITNSALQHYKLSITRWNDNF